MNYQLKVTSDISCSATSSHENFHVSQIQVHDMRQKGHIYTSMKADKNDLFIP